MKNIYQALLKAQIQMGAASKDATNPHFKSKYETLESVIEATKKPLNDNGIVPIHKLINKESGTFLVTMLVHAESGESVESEIELILNKNDMQQMGSAQTYAKRQNLKALTNLPSEDDDGNAAVQRASENKKQTPNIKKNDSDYIINLGDKNKMTGTRLQDQSKEWLIKFIEQTINYHKDNNKALHPNTQEFIEKAQNYLDSLDKK